MLIDEIVDVVMNEIDDEIDGYVDEFGANCTLEEYKAKLRSEIRFEVAQVLVKHGVLKTP